MALVASIGARDSREITDLLVGLVRLNLGQLRRGQVPPLNPGVDQGIRYKREDPGRERWQTARETFELKTGDCEDLSCWRAASLRLVGVPAMAVIIDVRPGLKHCVVRLPSGQILDPSKALGMKGGA